MTANDECAREILDVIPTVMRFIRAEMRSHRTAGLSVPQFRAMHRIGRAPGVSLGEVAEHLGLTPATTSTLVDGLVRRSLVLRTASAEDRRRVTLDLTREGRAEMETTDRETQSAISARIRGLDEPDLRRIRQAMPALRAAFADAHRPQAEGSR
jgi:DNA-binding MarR family transcriptional regulator